MIPRLGWFASVFLVEALGACGRLQGEAAPADGGARVDGGAGPSGDASVVDAGSPQSCPTPPCVPPPVDASGPATNDRGDAGDDGPNDASIDQLVEAFDAATVVGTCTSKTCGGSAGPLVLSLSSYPALTTVGGGVSVTLPGYSDPICNSDTVLVAQVAPGTFAAFAGSDTRSCCPLTVQSGAFRDPCYGSRYGFCGEPIQGPASRALQELPACAGTMGGASVVGVWVP